jgi:hypothetical protein
MDNSSIVITLADLSELAEVQTLFVNTVPTICVEDYSLEYINVWIASVEDALNELVLQNNTVKD